jgi:hypothetical protein
MRTTSFWVQGVGWATSGAGVCPAGGYILSGGYSISGTGMEEMGTDGSFVSENMPTDSATWTVAVVNQGLPWNLMVTINYLCTQ